MSTEGTIEIDPDEEQNETFTPVSNRDNVTVIHSGQPPPEHSPFSKPSTKTRWPEHLWSAGTLVYSIKYPEKCLPPPTSPSDTTLRFDSRFESGNLSRAYQMSPDSYHLILEYDHNSSGSCMWFYFAISNVSSKIKYNFFISGFHKEDSLYQTGAKVFLYSEKRAREQGISWTRSGSQYAYSVTSRTKTKMKRATLQFKIRFPYDGDLIYICNGLPYTYSDLLRSIMNWQSIAPTIFHTETLTQSVCGRDVPTLTLTNPDSPVAYQGKSCIFLTGRIHPGESNGSYVLHGLIDFLLSDHPFAKYILDHCLVKIVPMINIDGVVEGSYRVSLMGHDLNRMWTNPNPVMQPVVYATKELIKATAMERPLVVYIDFHGHSSLHGTFAYGCPNEDDKGLKDAEKTLPRLYSFISDEFSWEHCVFTFPKDRKDAGRIVVRREMGVVQSFTIETSFGGVKAGKFAGLLYDEILWKGLGASCGEAIYHLLIPTASPLVSYVNKELAFFAPKVLSKARAVKVAHSRDKKLGDKGKLTVKFNEVEENDEDPLEEIQRLTSTAIETGKKVRVKSTKKRLEFDANMISDKPPEVISPKWHQMKFTLQ